MGIVKHLLVVLLLMAAACTPSVRSGPAPAFGRVFVALVDSVPYATEMDEGVLHRVEVRSPAGVDTIVDVLTYVMPVVRRDGRVLGFAWEGADLREAFVYDPAGRRLERVPLPDDADRWFTTPAFSPDGRYLAYVAYEEGHGRGMVRNGARGPVIVRTEAVAVPGTDAALNFVKWMDAGTFVIYLDVGELGWHRFHGTVSAGVTRSDSVTLLKGQEPEYEGHP